MAVKLEIAGERWRSGVAFYNIDVISQGRCWTTHKRYTDFVTLNDELEMGSKLMRNAIPGKGCFGIRHRLNLFGFNQVRRAELELYLHGLASQVQTVGECQPLAKFLDSPASCDRSITEPPKGSSPLSSAESNSAELAVQAATPAERSVSAPAAPAAPRPRPAARPLKDFKPHFDRGCFTSSGWACFRRQEPELASVIGRCAELAESAARFQNDCEEVFQELRRCIMAMARRGQAPPRPQGALDEVPFDARGFVWDFLVLVAARRPFYRSQAIEVARLLENRPPWAQAAGKHPELRELKQEILTM